MYQQNDNDSIIRLSDNAHVPCVEGNRDYEQYKKWLLEGNQPEQPAGPTLDDLKQQKLTELNSACDAELEKVYSQYPEHEADTWFIQLQEARAYLADYETDTPFINIVAEHRGIGRHTLATSIVEKGLAFETFAAHVIGHKQRIRDQIEAVTTEAELDAIVIELSTEVAV